MRRAAIVRKASLFERVTNAPFELQLWFNEKWDERFGDAQTARAGTIAGISLTGMYLLAKATLGDAFTDSEIDFIEYSPIKSRARMANVGRSLDSQDSWISLATLARFIEMVVICSSVANAYVLFTSRRRVFLFQHPTQPNPVNPHDTAWNLRKKSRNAQLIEVDLAPTDESLVPSSDSDSNDDPPFKTPTPMKSGGRNGAYTPLTSRFRKKKNLNMLLDPVREIETNSLIREYFQYSDYRSTICAFDAECGLKGRVPEESMTARTFESPEEVIRLEEAKNRFLIAYREGDRKEFFALWDQHFPPDVTKTDPLFAKLEFQVSIYFAIFPMHPFVNQDAAKESQALTIQSTMDAFKSFLETRGAELCKTTQFLSFYALPYVPDARAHPSFNEIFTQRHVADLETRLVAFLESALKAVHVPRLLKILAGVDMRPVDKAKEIELQTKQLKLQLHESQLATDALSSKHRSLQHDHHNLLTIASELVQTLAACINGEKITPAYLTSIMSRVAEFKRVSANRKAPADFTETIRSATEKQSVTVESTEQISSPIRKMPQSALPQKNESKIDPDVLENLESFLDYEKIKLDLTPTTEIIKAKHQAFLLQALRSRLTMAPNIGAKRNVLKQYIRHDLLGIDSNRYIVEDILKNGAQIVREQTARLLNAIASESSGRDYLGYSPDIIPTLVNAMKGEAKDSLHQQNLLGTLQKLSLRRSAQSTMNAMHVLEYLHQLLENSGSLSEYSCEYGAALFMNLCLRTKGRKQCLQNPVRTLEVLLNLLEIDSMQIQTYVNGALYSLLSEPDFRTCANTLRLRDSLVFLQKSASEQVKGQIDFVLEQLSSTEEPSEDGISEDGDDEGEDDEDEDEAYPSNEDFDELSQTSPSEKTGTDILLPYVSNLPATFAASGGLAGGGATPRSSYSGAKKKETSRPTTPGLTKQSVIPPWPKDTEVMKSASKTDGDGKSKTPRKPANVPTTETEYVIYCFLFSQPL
ncbi:LisH domain-containing protein armc9 [Entophlyctis luteolus]|nr:LisH domain-containing protein armc9 [Entophlyctis luteolus]